TFQNDPGSSVAQRLAAGSNITLISSGLTYAGNSNATINDSFGKLTLVGASSITLPTGMPGMGVSFSSLDRVDGATPRVVAPLTTHDVGGPASGYTTQLKFSGGLPIVSDPNGPTGGQNTGIIPFLVIDSSTFPGNISWNLATYDADGVRLLRGT